MNQSPFGKTRPDTRHKMRLVCVLSPSKITRDRRTYGPTHLRTDGRTDTTSYKDATAHLKKVQFFISFGQKAATINEEGCGCVHCIDFYPTSIGFIYLHHSEFEALCTKTQPNPLCPCCLSVIRHQMSFFPRFNQARPSLPKS